MSEELKKIIFSELRFYSPAHPAGDLYYRFEIGLLSKAKFCEIMAEHLTPIIEIWHIREWKKRAKGCVPKEGMFPSKEIEIGYNQCRAETLKKIEEG